MTKKDKYFCQECGYESLGWLGKCPFCGQWNCMVEAPKDHSVNKSSVSKQGAEAWLNFINNDLSLEDKLYDLDKIHEEQQFHISSGIFELDRVLGGGFVPASLSLFGGSPGIGKSTLLLQVCKNMKKIGHFLYICGEESPAQIKLRAARLGLVNSGIKLLTETCFENIAEAVIRLKPKFIIVDSIQTLYLASLNSAPGTVSQVRETAFGFLRLAKQYNISICLVGHVTKDGQIAGPRVLEHMVDTVIYFEGENNNNIRIVRCVKNRFGPTDEIGMFNMTAQGLVSLENPSEELLKGRPQNTAGTIITACLQGNRSLLIEIQALITPSNFITAQRMTQGPDRNRVCMLLALIEKVGGIKLSDQDAYINIIGGLKLNDPAADLAIVTSIISSFKNKAVDSETVVIGELGLTGEIRPANNIEKRIIEAMSLGFKRIILPSGNKNSIKKSLLKQKCDLIFVDSLSQSIDVMFN